MVFGSEINNKFNPIVTPAIKETAAHIRFDEYLFGNAQYQASIFADLFDLLDNLIWRKG